MKQHNGVVKSAKIINVISAALMSLAGLLLLVIPNLETMVAQRIVLGTLFGLTGAAKIFGYFSNDLYRLAFQFDLAIGIFCILLTLLTELMPEYAFGTLPIIFAVYVSLDGLLKIQTSIDARRFGMKSWIVMLITAVLLFGAGGFALGAVLAQRLRPNAIVGIALMADGLENIWITASTVRIRARKKNLSGQFGLEEE
ncbi:MAG: DUF308 domain-containing protein [Faecousia sp.]